MNLRSAQGYQPRYPGGTLAMKSELGELHHETFVDSDDTVDPDVLAADIEAALAESRQWQSNGGRMTTTLVTNDGRFIGPEMMTREERQT